MTAEVYRDFAEIEARGVSPVFYEWAASTAADPRVLGLIEALPRPKRQPNLVFAAARFLGAPVGPYLAFREWLLDHWVEVEPVIMERSTQTNESGRCAVLLPELSRFEGPLALIEAGASAGLCLYPDRYSYRYDTGSRILALDPPGGPSPVELTCRIAEDSVPHRIPEVVWRAGVDLNPIDVRDPAEVQWLEALVWPEHHARRSRLNAAANLVATDPPRLLRGDLVDTVAELVLSAPAGTNVVVFHSAVLVYLEPWRREQFVDLMRSMPEVVWVSNEGERVLPQITDKVSLPVNGRTILSVNGVPTALVGPHGQSYEAL